MKREIYYTTSKGQRVYLRDETHPETIKFLSRQKMSNTRFKKFYASGFHWFKISAECQAMDKVVFFANKSKPIALYAICNSQTSTKYRIIESLRLKWFKVRAFFLKLIK